MTTNPEPDEQDDQYYDQDAEPTQKAPEEGRPDGTVAPDPDDQDG